MLSDDIDYMDQQGEIFSDSPNRKASIVFNKNNTNKLDIGPKQCIPYFPFYKSIDKSSKLDEAKRLEYL